jgi:hypothetical protein
MKIKLSLAALLAFAVVSVACAAPTEDPTAEQQPASEEDGKTAQQKEDLISRGGLGETCSVSCSSQDKLQTCCCGGINVKCVSLTATCQCQAASFSGGAVFQMQ